MKKLMILALLLTIGSVTYAQKKTNKLLTKEELESIARFIKEELNSQKLVK